MSIIELNSKYGAPGRIVFREGFAGYPNAVIANKYGSAEIALLGANVLSYKPTGHFPVIFRPDKKDAEYNRADSFHGGIPVCFPQFGNRFSKELPQHGFARKLVFEVRGTEYSDEITEVTLGLKSDEETLKLWPHEFDLEYKISISMKLNLTLTVVNKGDAPFDFSCGLHPYFRVRERDQATLKGLPEGELKIDRALDEIISMPEVAKHELAILDPGLKRAFALVSTGNTRTVVWNPGPENPLPDFSADDWRKFVCVEPVSDWPGGRTLAAGETYILAAAIQATMEGAV